MGAIETSTVSVAGHEVFVRRASGEGTPAVFVHGNPTHSADWMPFLEALEAPALAPDLIGFGRSAKPRGFDYSMSSIAEHFDRTLEELGVTEHNLVVHDWGVIGLLAALRRPQWVKRLVVINAVPLLPRYRWHWVARLWRRRLIGEAVNATTTKAAFALSLRQARPGFRAMPREFVDESWRLWDRRTRRAVLELYRSADPERLEAAGEGLTSLRCPALVVWGAEDPYLPTRFGEEYARRLPNSEFIRVDSAGHWPWIDQPELIERVVAFLGSRS